MLVRVIGRPAFLGQAEKVPIDPHEASVPEEMIERVIATRNVRDCNACKSEKTKPGS
jgi:hypothetical protein